MASFDTPSSSDNSNFVRKPLSPAALALATIIGASSPQLIAQAEENHVNDVN